MEGGSSRLTINENGVLALPKVEHQLLRMILDSEAGDLSALGLSPDDFTNADFGKIFGLCLKAEGRCDLVTLYDPCEALGISEALLSLTSNAIYSDCTAQDYAEKLLDATRRRELVRVCTDTIRRAQLPDEKLEGLLSGFQSGVDDLAARSVRTQAVEIGQAIEAYNNAVFSANAKPLVGTGFPALDQLLGGGFDSTEFILLGGLTGAGKSTFALHIAANAARNGRRVLMLGTEMEPRDNVKRLSVAEAYSPFGRCLTSSRLRRRDLSQEEREELRRVQARLREALGGRLRLLGGMCSVQTLRREALAMKRSGGLDLIVVDYLQQMCSGDARTDREEYVRVSAVSRALKSMTVELGCPVLAAVQYSREANKAERPMMHHLRGSGQLEQDANLILSIHRPAAVKEDDTEALQCARNCKAHGLRYLQLFVDKGRDLPDKGMLHYAFDGDHNQLFDARADFGAREQRFD